MQLEVIFTGLGGQGVQLCAKSLALAATIESRHALMTARYGGEVRGGQSEASVAVGDLPLRGLPILPRTWSAIVMHDAWWEPVRSRLGPDGPVLVNSTLVETNLGVDESRVVEIPATEIAVAGPGAMTACLVLTGAYIAVTGIVSIESLTRAMRRLVPQYRTQHLAANESALTLGFEAAPLRSKQSPFAVVAGV